MRREFVATPRMSCGPRDCRALSAVETAAGAAQDPKARETFLDIIYRQAARMHSLVSDLPDLSRLERQDLKLTLWRCRLSMW